MIGQDFQAKLDQVVEDLQIAGRGQTVEVLLRGADNSSTVFPLSSTAQGVVNAAQLAAIQTFIDDLKPLADSFATELAPVSAASEAFTLARSAHQPLIDAASAARTALADALEGDRIYMDAKAVYDTARTNAAYVAARDAYKAANVSENFGNLSDAKGKYVGVPNTGAPVNPAANNNVP